MNFESLFEKSQEDAPPETVRTRRREGANPFKEELDDFGGRRRALIQFLRPYILTFMTTGAALGTGYTAGAMYAEEREKTPSVAIKENSEDEDFPSKERMLEEMKERTAYVEYEIETHKKNRERRSEEKRVEKMSVSGFERLGISQDVMDSFLEAYPSSWTRGAAVRSFSFNPHPVPMRYKGMEKKFEFAHCDCNKAEAGVIEVTSTGLISPDKETVWRSQDFLLREVLTHEFVHANSWITSERFTEIQSIELRYLVYRAVKAEGRPKFSYPEGIEERKTKAVHTTERMHEYFGELVTHALSTEFVRGAQPDWDAWQGEFASSLITAHQAESIEAAKNAHLIKWYFSHIDPEFKPWEAAKKLKTLRIEDRQRRHREEFIQMLSETADPTLAEALRDRLQHRYKYQHQVPVPKQFLDSSTTTAPAPIIGEHEVKLAKIWQDITLLVNVITAQQETDAWRYDLTKLPNDFREFNEGWKKLSPSAKDRLRLHLLDELGKRFSSYERIDL